MGICEARKGLRCSGADLACLWEKRGVDMTKNKRKGAETEILQSSHSDGLPFFGIDGYPRALTVSPQCNGVCGHIRSGSGSGRWTCHRLTWPSVGA